MLNDFVFIVMVIDVPSGNQVLASEHSKIYVKIFLQGLEIVFS